MKINLKYNLKALRETRNLTQQEVADAINVSRSSYTYYETGGRYPSVETLSELAKIFKTSIDALVNGEFVFGSGPSLYNRNNLLSFDILDSDEKALIMSYRCMSDKDKEELADIAKQKKENTNK